MQSIKEHNLKANHNRYVDFDTIGNSVCNLSKNTIWKQITTSNWYCKSRTSLYAIYQRTQSESKSQQDTFRWDRNKICMQSIKEHNLKANHNCICFWVGKDYSVCNLSKNTIWKQITTLLHFQFLSLNLYAIYQRTQSESKSQHVFQN